MKRFYIGRMLSLSIAAIFVLMSHQADAQFQTTFPKQNIEFFDAAGADDASVGLLYKDADGTNRAEPLKLYSIAPNGDVSFDGAVLLNGNPVYSFSSVALVFDTFSMAHVFLYMNSTMFHLTWSDENWDYDTVTIPSGYYSWKVCRDSIGYFHLLGTGGWQDASVVRYRAYFVGRVQVPSKLTLQLVTECNCVTVRWGGEQQEVNDQSVG